MSGLDHDEDLSDLLNELRALVTGSQMLTGFLMILPFSQGFKAIEPPERPIFTAAFICALLSLILFIAPAAQHRLRRPIPDKEAFKRSATRHTILGLVPFSVALTLACQLVISSVMGDPFALVLSAVIALAIVTYWWAIPLIKRARQ